MRRLRVPTMPNMGLPSSRKRGESLQACDSAIFADAEEESSRAENRPAAPHFSSLRRSHTQQEERYEDVSHEGRLDKLPLTTTKLKNLTSLAAREESIIPEEQEDAHHIQEDQVNFQNQEEQAHVASRLETKNVSVVVDEIVPAQGDEERCVSNETDESTQTLESLPGRIDSSCHSRLGSLNEIISNPRKRSLSDALKTSTQKAVEMGNMLLDRLPHEAIPQFQQKVQVGVAFVIAKVVALSGILKWTVITIFHFLDKIKVRQVQQDNGAIDICPSEKTTKKDAKDAETRETTLSTRDMQISVEKGSPTSTPQESTTAPPEAQTQPDTAEYGRKLAALSFDMTEETMTTVPRLTLPGQPKEYISQDQKTTTEHPNDNIITSESLIRDSGIGVDPRRGMNSTKGFHANGSSSEPSAETHSQGRDSAEHLVNELDQSSLRLERRESEIILSPLNSTHPTFASDTEFDMRDMNRMDYAGRGTEIAGRPRRQSTEVNALTRLSGRNKGPRGPTAKLKHDARILKDSIFRVFGRNKVEPETRFASPRSARKTLTLVADMLVREYRCDVAIRRNGALKVRCEKIFPGNEKLNIRLAFQPMDAFSCNVVVCRSREDCLQVSTTDYVAFVADLQRSFLNATSEGMQGSHIN